MVIYRVTLENSFSDEILQSHYFSSESAAVGYADMLKEELETEPMGSMHDIVVAAYTPDDGGEFFYDHDIKVYEV